MAVTFDRQPPTWIAEHAKRKPPKTADEHVGLNGRIAILVTAVVGTMWCAYAFAILALIALPSAIKSGDPLQLVGWISQTFIQMVLLSVIIVGQNIQSRASDKRAEMTYKDAEATFYEAQQIHDHLEAQDDAIGILLEKLGKLEGGGRQS